MAVESEPKELRLPLINTWDGKRNTPYYDPVLDTYMEIPRKARAYVIGDDTFLSGTGESLTLATWKQTYKEWDSKERDLYVPAGCMSKWPLEDRRVIEGTINTVVVPCYTLREVKAVCMYMQSRPEMVNVRAIVEYPERRLYHTFYICWNWRNLGLDLLKDFERQCGGHK